MSVTIVKTKYEIIRETKYLRFTLLERPSDKKTDVVIIDSISGGYTLGRIQWFSRWRQYGFFPYNETVWNSTCVNDVQKVIDYLNEKRKNETNNKRANNDSR